MANFVEKGPNETAGGDASDPTETPACTCTASEVRRYLAKVSGPLMDRLDITIETAALGPSELDNALPGEDSATVRKRVLAARARQGRRGPKLNSQLGTKELRETCKISRATQKSVEEAKAQFGFSSKRITSMLGLARTIADLVGSDAVEVWHWQEAVNYRPLASKLFA